MKTDSRLSPIAMETQIFRMYGSDAGQPTQTLYRKAFMISITSCSAGELYDLTW